MRTLAIWAAALIMIGSLVPIASGQQAGKDKTVPRQRSPRPDFDRRSEQGQAAQKLQSQIEELQAAHQKLVTELRAIHAAALKEKAAKTAALVEKLINDRQRALQEDVHRLELQQQRLLQSVGENGAQRNDVKLQPRPAPDFALSSFEGKVVKLADYRDSIVVLEWLNTDCPFVQYHYDKAGTMIELAKKYKDKNVVWLAINSTNQTTPEANREFAKKHNLPYPILDDRSGTVGRLYGAITTPHLFIIHKGVVVYDGAIDNAPNGTPIDGGTKINYVDKALSELTSGQPVSTPKTQSYGCSVKYASQIPAEPKTKN
jgi:peroxiredoxin